MKKFMLTGFLTASLLSAIAQENLLKQVEDSTPIREKVYAAFKSTRVINAHSTEMLAEGNMDVRILHRFGLVNSGVKGWYGLDAAYMRMGFDYGLTNNMMLGIGRSTFRKEVDGFVKIRTMQQTTGPREIPFSLLLAVGTMVWTEPSADASKPDAADRTSYYLQLIAGRKFSERFSLQLSPILLHRNWVATRAEDNTTFALGGGARYKFNKRLALTLDYHHTFKGLAPGNSDPLSVGIDIETGGHVFQLHFSNTQGMNERAYLTETTERFFNGDIRFGFNLSRIFKLGGKKKQHE